MGTQTPYSISYESRADKLPVLTSTRSATFSSHCHTELSLLQLTIFYCHTGSTRRLGLGDIRTSQMSSTMPLRFKGCFPLSTSRHLEGRDRHNHSMGIGRFPSFTTLYWIELRIEFRLWSFILLRSSFVVSAFSKLIIRGALAAFRASQHRARSLITWRYHANTEQELSMPKWTIVLSLDAVRPVDTVWGCGRSHESLRL